LVKNAKMIKVGNVISPRSSSLSDKLRNILVGSRP
jgi:hypothetical protein